MDEVDVVIEPKSMKDMELIDPKVGLSDHEYQAVREQYWNEWFGDEFGAFDETSAPFAGGGQNTDNLFM